MPPEIQQLEDELTAALSIEDERFRAERLLELAPALTDRLLDRLLVAINALQDYSLRSSTLASVAPYLKGEQLNKAVALASRIGNLIPRNFALGALGPYLPEAERNKVIDTVKSSPTAEYRLKGWMGLYPYLTSDLKNEAISTALSLSNDVERAEALIALAPHLTEVWKIKALESAKKISDPITKIETLAGLIPELPKRERADALDEALSRARELSDSNLQGLALLKLLPLVPEDLKDDLTTEIRNVAGRSTDDRQFVDLLVQLAALQSPGKGATTLEVAFSSLTDIDDETTRGDALLILARSGFPEIQTRILQAAKKIKDPHVKSRVIIQLQSIIEQDSLEPISSVAPEVLPSAPPPIQDFPESPDVPPGESAAATTDLEDKPSAAVAVEDIPLESETPAEIILEEGKPLKIKTPRKKAPKVATSPSPQAEKAQEIASEDPSRGVKAFLHSDRWTLEDQLDHMLYADAITEFILHPDTKPPLAIGILAPWGQGKTTLMRLIQNQLRLKVEAQVKACPTGVVVPPITTSLKFSYLRKWIQNPTHYKLDETKLLKHPTVWFNAWKYQDTEQFWAGMAYSILSQLVEQIEGQDEREKFWLALQAERVDFNAIRRDIHRMIFERVAPWIGISMVVAVVGFLLVIGGFIAGNILWGSSGGIVMLAGVLVPALKWLATSVNVNSKPLEGKFAQYVRQPTYEGKLGFFHEVEMDVQRVFRLLIAQGKPAVIFIDDLDRCTPGTVAKVIEAMNLFLSAEFPDCYFVVGMDAQVVAASMEVAYENLDKKMKGVTRNYGSLGWYFMDKFIQLQFSIPNLTPEQRSTYLNKLLGQAPKTEILPPAELDRVEQQVEANLSSTSLKTEEMPEQAAELSKLRLQRPQTWQRLTHTLIKARAQQLTDDNPTLQKYIERYEPFLGASPRGIKRFTNLLRFYDLCQVTRRAQGLQASSQSALARWLVIMLRWPQVVRWIQWEGETKLTTGESAFDKAEAFESQLIKTKTHAAWLTHLEKVDPKPADWMVDKQLYEFLKITDRSDEKLSLAVQTGVW